MAVLGVAVKPRKVPKGFEKGFLDQVGRSGLGPQLSIRFPSGDQQQISPAGIEHLSESFRGAAGSQRSTSEEGTGIGHLPRPRDTAAALRVVLSVIEDLLPSVFPFLRRKATGFAANIPLPERSRSGRLAPVLDSLARNAVIIRRAAPDPDAERIRGPDRRPPTRKVLASKRARLRAAGVIAYWASRVSCHRHIVERTRRASRVVYPCRLNSRTGRSSSLIAANSCSTASASSATSSGVGSRPRGSRQDAPAGAVSYCSPSLRGIQYGCRMPAGCCCCPLSGDALVNAGSDACPPARVTLRNGDAPPLAVPTHR